MKTFFSVLISYILLCAVGVTLTALLIMIYIECTDFVVGHSLNLFSFTAFKAGVGISLPLVMTFIPMFLILSLVRHSRKNRFIGIITIAALTCASWVIGLRFVLNYQMSLETETVTQPKRLSKGYFRLSEDVLYYFSNVDAESNTDGIAIDLKNTTTEKDSFKIIENEKLTIPESGNFSDVLVKRVIEIPPLLKKEVDDLKGLSIEAKKAASSSMLDWLFFCSFAAALVFVFALTSVSQWRLITAFFIVIATGLVIKVNAICCSVSVYKDIFPFLPQLDQNLRNTPMLSSIMSNPLCVVMNAVLIVLFIIVGLIGKFKNRPAGSGEN